MAVEKVIFLMILIQSALAQNQTKSETVSSHHSNKSTVHITSTFSPKIDEFYLKFKTRLDELKANNFSDIPQAFLLSNQIQSEIEKNEINHAAKMEFQKILLDFPRTSRALINGSEVYIRSSAYKYEYLYASDFEYDNVHRRVFTWRPGSVTSKSMWKFSTKDGGRTFQIKNLEYDAFLMSSDVQHDENRRFVFTRKIDEATDNFGWYIESLKDEKIRLMNKKTKEYFYTAIDKYAYDDERRNVFTWIPKNDKSDESFFWKLEEVY